MSDELQRKSDPIADLIAMRNYVAWRDLRFEPLDSPASRKMLAKLASDIPWRSKGGFT